MFAGFGEKEEDNRCNRCVCVCVFVASLKERVCERMCMCEEKDRESVCVFAGFREKEEKNVCVCVYVCV